MSVAETYRRLAADFAGTLAKVPDDRWENQSPCAEWTARDVVGHVVQTQHLFEGFVGRTLTPGPDVTEDPLAAFIAVRDQVQAHLDDPAAAEASFDGYFGRSTFAEAVDRFLCFDLVVHRWDVGTAVGLTIVLDPADCRRVEQQADAFGDALRGPSTCGPAVDAGPDPDDQARMLAFLGRSPTQGARP